MPNCQYCGKEVSEKGLFNHEKYCKENPENKGDKNMENKELTDKELKKEYETMKDQLKSEKHVDIFIPPSELYPKGSSVPVGVNGVTYQIPVGVRFTKGVPVSVFEAWETSYNDTEKAQAKIETKLKGEIQVM